MPLWIYNTLTRKKEKFDFPLNYLVRMFVCGPTVYDYCHLGHAKTYITFDVIAKYLRFKGYRVFFLMNITDIDEKIIKKSKEIGMDFLKLSKKFEKYFFEDLRSLKIESINTFARASEHIPEIIKQINLLIKKGFAYETETGVYFNVKKFPEYGKLSNQTKEEISLRPLELCRSKKHPEDFSLWKKIEEEPSWSSPWGFGRPGWHIEDTAIAMKFFGHQYDIHGGAVELIFPHHEAEIAQGEALTGKKPYVKYWIHTGLLKINGRKMSKSLGNVIYIKDILKSYDYRTLRFYLLSKHYRKTFNFNIMELKKSKEKLKSIEEAIYNFSNLSITYNSICNSKLIKDLETFKTMFISSMDDDFNTPKAIKAIQMIARKFNDFAKRYRKIDEYTKRKALKTFYRLVNIIGIL